jgi:hypothetical protein
MNTRLVEVYPRKDYTADFTEIIDINLVDPISKLVVTYEPDCAAPAGVAAGHPVRCITKIELVDGSDVLFSLNGAEAHAVDFFNTRCIPPGRIRYLNGQYHKVNIGMNFGRFLFDPDMAIDPKRHNNLQLKITGDINGGSEGADDGYLTVFAHVFDQKMVSPKGFLMTKEVKQYTMVNGSHEYTDLPLDYVYKQLFLRAQRYGTAPDDQVDTIKLSEDQDKKIPINSIDLKQWIDVLAGYWPKYTEMILVAALTVATNYFCAPTRDVKGVCTEWRSAQAGGTASIYSGAGGRFSHDGSAAGPNWQCLLEGKIPHGTVPLLPEYSNDPADWYDVRGLKSLRLDVKGAADVGTSQTAEIIVQQLRNYA